MVIRILFYSIFSTVLFISGCGVTIQEIITCDPPQADIYWGKTSSNLEKTGYKTQHSRSMSALRWESWCYQVKKDGYHDSYIICRPEENHRNLDFYLAPLRITITSEPPNAIIYWGPSRDNIYKTEHRTPRTVTVKNTSDGASWMDWYYQVKKDGHHDSELVFLPQGSSDRNAHFSLKPFKLQVSIDPASSGQATLSWEDRYPNELGFEIERKEGSLGTYHMIAIVGPNVTSYADTGLEKGMIYYYRVRSYDSYGYSAYSEETRVRISAD